MNEDYLYDIARVRRNEFYSTKPDYIEKADSYFSLHEDQEFMARIETLGLTNKIISQHKKLWRSLAIAGALLIVLLLTLALVFKRIDRLQKEKEGADAAIEDALQEGEENSENFLSEREEQILPLIAAGYTSPQIAEKVYLSLPTIKWYRKRLLEKFDAANTAELISKAKEKSLI